MSLREPSVRVVSERRGKGAGHGVVRPLSAPVVVRENFVTEERGDGDEGDPTPLARGGQELTGSSSQLGRKDASLADSMLDTAREALGNLEDLKKWVYDDSSKSSLSNRVSAATKQRALRKTLLKIATTCHSLKELELKCENSKTQEAELELELKLKEESRYDTLNTLNETAGELQRAVDDLKSLREKHDVLERENVIKERKLEDLEDRSKQTLEALNKLEEAHQRTEAEKGEITDRYNKLVETERKLHLPDLRNALSSATAKVAKYEKSLEQSQKIIAQVTADNLVFLTKFKDAEEKFRESEMRREELQVMVDEQKGPWFDKVRGDIQQQVESDWQKIHNLENELSAAELESKKEINRLQEKVEGLSSENEELQKVKGSMEERIKSLKEKLRQREEKDIKAATDFESLNQLLKDNLAENKVLRETINDERHTIADLTLESQDQKHVIEQLKSDLKFDRVTLQELRVNLQKEKWALETQRRINKELMSRKEEMEWRLMEFQVGGGEGKSAEDSNADLAAMREEAGTGGRQESHSRPSANSAEKQPEAVAPRKDDAVKSDFSYKVVEKEKKVEEQVVERKSPGFREEVCEPSGKDDTQEGSVPAGLTESNLKRHIQGEKASKASKASSEASGKAAKGERLTIEELEDNIATSKDKHAELLQAFFPAQSEKRIEENPLQVHQRLVQKIIGDDTYVPVSHSVPSGEISSADATIASMLRESITENSSIGELEASIALAKSEYSKMMDNFSNLVDNLKNESASPGLETMPVLPESIQKMAEEQFVEHWQIADGNHSETKESIQASEIKVSEWLDNKISEEWNKQFMPGYQEGDES